MINLTSLIFQVALDVKQNFIFFIAILIPNYFRQISYFIQRKKLKKLKFIDSFETSWFFKKKLYFLGFIEETIIAIAFTFFYFSLNLKFFVYAWIFDAFQDIFIAFFGNFYIKAGIKNKYERFLLREVILPYSLIGPIIQLLLS